MAKGIEFVSRTPEFNKENLFILYRLLSDGCLEKENRLKEDECYRYDEVEVDGYLGCPHEKIEECMESLFSYVNSHLKDGNMNYLLPHIAHYYLVYVHPYFDFNGRTARMVSLWVNLLTGHSFYPSIISEAIDQTKSRYYRSLEETRNDDNDLTYFLLYLYKISLDYLFCYKNIEYITQQLQNRNIVWTETEKSYFKKILISHPGSFSYKDFFRIAKIDISRQGALKILNRFVSYGLLDETMSNAKTKLFKIKPECLKYDGSNLLN